MLRPSAIGLLLLCASLLLGGCGYDVVRYGASHPGGKATGAERSDLAGRPRLTVVTLANDTDEPGVELIVSEAIRREALTRGGFRLVSDPDVADYVVRGQVRELTTQSRSYTGVVLAVEYRITMMLGLQVTSADGPTTSLPASLLEATEIYLASADIEASRKNRVEAVRRMAVMLASRIHDTLDHDLRTASR